MYLLKARHRNRSRVQAPFVMDFLTDVVFDRKKYGDYSRIEGVRKALRKEEKRVPVKDIGGKSRVFLDNERKISDLLRYSSVSSKYGQLLHRAAKHYNPKTIIELGTSIGMSSLYMATGMKGGTLYTVEGNEALLQVAKELSNKAGVSNIVFKLGLFDDILPELLGTISSPEFVFIDGNHTYEATTVYYTLIRKKMKNGLILFDDIYWSKGMRKAWNWIKSQEQMSIDLNRMGIILVREKAGQGHYTVRF